MGLKQNKESVIEGLTVFHKHYAKQFTDIKETVLKRLPNNCKIIQYRSRHIKHANGPIVFHHGRKTDDAIILVHGLSDSPYYMSAVGEQFAQIGMNVLLPLLPAHGLINPSKMITRPYLGLFWKNEVAAMVKIAQRFGRRISIGGLSTGGTLSISCAIDLESSITGALFLFGTALYVGALNEIAGLSRKIVPTIARFLDYNYKAEGPNPYRYPVFTQYGGSELIKIIWEIRSKLRGKILKQPVFAAHFAHDATAKIEGIHEFMTNHVLNGILFNIVNDPLIFHSSIVLEKEILIKNVPGTPSIENQKANPQFHLMMNTAINFFKDQFI